MQQNKFHQLLPCIFIDMQHIFSNSAALEKGHWPVKPILIMSFSCQFYEGNRWHPDCSQQSISWVSTRTLGRSIQECILWVQYFHHSWRSNCWKTIWAEDNQKTKYEHIFDSGKRKPQVMTDTGRRDCWSKWNRRDLRADLELFACTVT